MSILSKRVEEARSELVILQYPRTVNSASRHPIDLFLEEEYRDNEHASGDVKRVVTLMNCILNQNAHYFLLHRKQFREALAADTNWMPSVGLKNENWQKFVKFCIKLKIFKQYKVMKNSKGRDVPIFETCEPTLLSLLSDSDKEKQLDKIERFLNGNPIGNLMGDPDNQKMSELQNERISGLADEPENTEQLTEPTPLSEASAFKIIIGTVQAAQLETTGVCSSPVLVSDVVHNKNNIITAAVETGVCSSPVKFKLGQTACTATESSLKATIQGDLGNTANTASQPNQLKVDLKDSQEQLIQSKERKVAPKERKVEGSSPGVLEIEELLQSSKLTPADRQWLEDKPSRLVQYGSFTPKQLEVYERIRAKLTHKPSTVDVNSSGNSPIRANFAHNGPTVNNNSPGNGPTRAEGLSSNHGYPRAFKAMSEDELIEYFLAECEKLGVNVDDIDQSKLCSHDPNGKMLTKPHLSFKKFNRLSPELQQKVDAIFPKNVPSRKSNGCQESEDRGFSINRE